MKNITKIVFTRFGVEAEVVSVFVETMPTPQDFDAIKKLIGKLKHNAKFCLEVLEALGELPTYVPHELGFCEKFDNHRNYKISIHPEIELHKIPTMYTFEISNFKSEDPNFTEKDLLQFLNELEDIESGDTWGGDTNIDINLYDTYDFVLGLNMVSTQFRAVAYRVVDNNTTDDDFASADVKVFKDGIELNLRNSS